MGMGAALKLQCVVANTRRIFAIELTAAAQGIDLLRPLRSSDDIEALHEAFRRRVLRLREDREMATDLNAAHAFLDEIDSFLEDLL